VTITLRDRIRRWWRPARWEDDHPAERQPKKDAAVSYATREEIRKIEESRARYGSGGGS